MTLGSKASGGGLELYFRFLLEFAGVPGKLDIEDWNTTELSVLAAKAPESRRQARPVDKKPGKSLNVRMENWGKHIHKHRDRKWRGTGDTGREFKVIDLRSRLSENPATGKTRADGVPEEVRRDEYSDRTTNQGSQT